MTTTPTDPANADFLALEEIHAAALRALPAEVAGYLESGAGTEQTLRANREAFTRWVIRPRPMSGVTAPDTSTEVLGIPLSVPVLTAPFGGDGLFAPDGHLAVARANAACGTASIVPEVGTLLLRGGRRRGARGGADRPAAPVRVLRLRGEADPCRGLRPRCA